MHDDGWRPVFFVAALFNYGLGLALLFIPATMLPLVGQHLPDDLVFVRLAGLLIASYGIGYHMISRAPSANRNLVWLGMVGKLLAVGLFAQQWLAGLLSTTAFGLGTGDLLFAALFWTYLQRVPARD